MQASEFQPKLSSVIGKRVYTLEELKIIIKQIVAGNDVDIGMELSQPRLAEILIKILDFCNTTDSSSGASLNNSPSYTIQGNNTNSLGPIKNLTVQEVILMLSEFQGSGPFHMKGLVPDPGPFVGNTRFLNENGTFQVPAGGGGGGNSISEIEVDGTLIRYIVTAGSPTITALKSAGVQTITIAGGTIKLLSICTIGTIDNLAGDNSFKIICNGVSGTALLAYPIVQKWNLSGLVPSDLVPHIADIDNTPQVQLTAGTAGTSITIRLVNLNAFTNWAIKLVW